MQPKRLALSSILATALLLAPMTTPKADGLWGAIKTVTGLGLIMGVVDLAMEERSVKQATADKKLQIRINEHLLKGASGFGGWFSVSATVYNNVALITGGVENDTVHKNIIQDITQSGLVSQFIDRITLEKETDPGMAKSTETGFKVEAAIRAQPGVKSSNLYWPTVAGKVYLFGWARNAEEENLAVNAVRTVENVKSVESLIARPGKTLPVTTVSKKK